MPKLHSLKTKNRILWKKTSFQLTHCHGQTWEKGNLIAGCIKIQVERELQTTEIKQAKEKFHLLLNYSLRTKFF